MDWLCPGYTSKLGGQLQEYHGQIDSEVTVRSILPTVQTGNLHAAVFDLTAQQVYVSFCRKTTADASEPEFAYERQFSQLDMNSLFSLAKPAI